MNHLIPRPIFPKLRLQPRVECPGLTDAVVVILDTKHVSQPVEHVRLVAGRIQQGVNQTSTPIRTPVILKRGEFLNRRNTADHVEIDPPDELNIADRRIRL